MVSSCKAQELGNVKSRKKFNRFFKFIKLKVKAVCEKGKVRNLALTK